MSVSLNESSLFHLISTVQARAINPPNPGFCSMGSLLVPLQPGAKPGDGRRRASFPSGIPRLISASTECSPSPPPAWLLLLLMCFPTGKVEALLRQWDTAGTREAPKAGRVESPALGVLPHSCPIYLQPALRVKAKPLPSVTSPYTK